MEQWSGKVAVITGASSGIGAATAVELALAGMIVIGMARRTKLIDNLNHQVFSNSTACSNYGKIYSHYLDVNDMDSINRAFNWVDEKFGQIDVIVNSAGIARINLLLDGSANPNSDFELQNLINTNLMGSIYTIRAAYKIMQKNNNYAHIITLDDTWGHSVPRDPKYLYFLNTYPVSKLALSAVAEVIRIELDAMKNKKIKCTNLIPDWVKTGIVKAAGVEDDEAFYRTIDYIYPKDVADSILYILGTPRHVLVTSLTLKVVGGTQM